MRGDLLTAEVMQCSFVSKSRLETLMPIDRGWEVNDRIVHSCDEMRATWEDVIWAPVGTDPQSALLCVCAQKAREAFAPIFMPEESL